MKKLIASLTLASTLLSATPALAASGDTTPTAENNPYTYHTVQWFDWIWNFTGRVKDRTIEPEVRDHQSKHDPATREVLELDVSAYEANMCWMERRHCVYGSDASDAESCFQFTTKKMCQ